MEPQRLHILGASGTGTTTLGRAIADEWSVPHADADDYFWEPTDPPFTAKRDPSRRVALMEEIFLPRDSWVLSGSLMGWGDVLIPLFDCVVFLALEPSVRLDRLVQRERRRYGGRVDPGGDMADAHAEFLAWASGYDDRSFQGRSLHAHERWLSELRCPVVRADSSMPIDHLVSTIIG